MSSKSLESFEVFNLKIENFKRFLKKFLLSEHDFGDGPGDPKPLTAAKYYGLGTMKRRYRANVKMQVVWLKMHYEK